MSNASINLSGQDREVIELFAEKIVLEIWLDAFYRKDVNEKKKQLEIRREPLIQNFVDWLALPQELWLLIFRYLSQAELYFVIHKVCKLFDVWSRDISLWRTIDFSQMHVDLSVIRNKGILSVPAKVTEADLSEILKTYFDTLTSVKISRFSNDCGLNDVSLRKICNCSLLIKLDIGFNENVNLKAIVESCPMIEDLNLEGCSTLKDEDFANIHLLTNLRRLSVSHCGGLTNQFLIYLYKSSNLIEFISDGVMHPTDRDLIEFMRHRELIEVLVLDGEDKTDIVVSFAANNLPNLRVFEFHFSQCLTDEGILSFKKKILIEGLKFRKCSNITDSSICKLFKLDSTFYLKSFTVTESPYITDPSLFSISQCCPHLQSFAVDWCWYITDKGVAEVVNKCKDLRRLSLVGLTLLKGEGWLGHIDQHLPNLELLDTSDCNLLQDSELIKLVSRKPSLEVYSYYHERVQVNSIAYERTCDLKETSSDEEWVCPGERGVEIKF